MGIQLRNTALHPLATSSFGNLCRLFLRYGCDARYLYRAVWIGLCSLAQQPLIWHERMQIGRQIDRQDIVSDPIFIVGHWRSGTTHLQNLLAQDPQFGRVTLRHAALPNSFLTQPRWAARLMESFLPDRRLMDNVPLAGEVPWEEEMALCGTCRYSFFHVSFFPRRVAEIFRDAVLFNGGDPALIAQWRRHYMAFLKKVQLAQPGKPLLLKNPANTARIAILKRMFPGARFVHIHRDPMEVYASTRHLYEKAQAAWGLQNTSREQLFEHILLSYRALMEAYFTQKAGLAGGDLVEVRFTDLENHPIAALERVYRTLDLPDFDLAAPHFRTYLADQRDYRKNRLSLSAVEAAQVRAHWGAIAEQLGYDLSSLKLSKPSCRAAI